MENAAKAPAMRMSVLVLLKDICMSRCNVVEWKAYIVGDVGEYLNVFRRHRRKSRLPGPLAPIARRESNDLEASSFIK